MHPIVFGRQHEVPKPRQRSYADLETENDVLQVPLLPDSIVCIAAALSAAALVGASAADSICCCLLLRDL